jgi:hypothetical protein
MPACNCEEKKKPLTDRNWEVASWKPYKCYGPNASSYDGRMLLDITCLSCGGKTRNKNKNSPIWDAVKTTPYSGKLFKIVLNAIPN